MVLKDFVIARRGHQVLFALANLLDDHLMQISHVIRGQEFLTTTPQQVLLAEALGLPLPKYAHLPLIADPTTAKKLSKRKLDTTISQYREEGLCAQAIVNYTAYLGFNPLDQNASLRDSLRALPQLAEQFDLRDISKAPVRFDKSKLLAFNRLYWLDYLNHRDKNAFEAERFRDLLSAAFDKYSDRITALKEHQVLALRECAERFPFRLDMLEFAFCRPEPSGSYSHR
jgi:glutamyl/glutaminyl-tRNA synthetase